MMVVLAIILILAGFVLAISGYMHEKGARSRTEAEVATISAALEDYKADNGVYPISALVDPRTQGDPTTQYQTASAILYAGLSGDGNGDGQPDLKSYINFRLNQIGGSSPSLFLKDPFGNSYGYSTVGQSGEAAGYNPTFDLWSTGGGTDTHNPPDQSHWIKNW